jgi:hypothetical protein
MKEFDLKKLTKNAFNKMINKKVLENNIKLIKTFDKNHINSLVIYKNNSSMNKILITKKLPYSLKFDIDIYELKKHNSIKNPIDLKKKFLESYLSLYSNIDNIFNKMSYLPTITLYRGIKISKKSNKENLLNKLQNKNNNHSTNIILLSYLLSSHFKEKNKTNYDQKTFTEKSYLSTSLNPSVAYNYATFLGSIKNNFDKIMFKIEINKNDKIPFIFLSDIFINFIDENKNLKKINNWNKTEYDEFEILLPRNIEFEVVKIEDEIIYSTPEGFKNVFQKNKKEDKKNIIKVITIKPKKYKKPELFKLETTNYNLII